jgi:hypothetical protein
VPLQNVLWLHRKTIWFFNATTGNGEPICISGRANTYFGKIEMLSLGRASAFFAKIECILREDRLCISTGPVRNSEDRDAENFR